MSVAGRGLKSNMPCSLMRSKASYALENLQGMFSMENAESSSEAAMNCLERDEQRERYHTHAA